MILTEPRAGRGVLLRLARFIAKNAATSRPSRTIRGIRASFGVLALYETSHALQPLQWHH